MLAGLRCLHPGLLSYFLLLSMIRQLWNLPPCMGCSEASSPALPDNAHSQQNRETTLISTLLGWSKEASPFSSTRPSALSHYAFSCREQGHWSAAGNIRLCAESCGCSLRLGFSLGQARGREDVPTASISPSCNLVSSIFLPWQSLVTSLGSAGERLANFLLVAWELRLNLGWLNETYMVFLWMS